MNLTGLRRIECGLFHISRMRKEVECVSKKSCTYIVMKDESNAKYVPVLDQTAKENGIAFKTIHIESKVEAQNAPIPITNYALFHDGKYVTNEQMNEKKFLKLAGK